MKYLASAAALVFAGFLLFGSRPSNGTTLVARDLEYMASASDNICTGRVIDKTSFLRQGRIYTLNRIEVVDSVKGRFKPGAVLEIITAGGRSEFFSQKVFGAPELVPERSYLFFLEHRGTPGVSHPVGMTQGVLPIGIGAIDREPVVHPPESLPRLLTRDAAGRLHPGSPWLSEAKPLRAVLDQIQAHLGGPR